MYQMHMFLYIGRDFNGVHCISVFILGILKLPFDISLEIIYCILAICITFCSHNELSGTISTAVNLTTHAVRADTGTIIKVNTEEIILIACNPACPASVTYCFFGMLAKKPVYDINIMNVSIENMIAA